MTETTWGESEAPVRKKAVPTWLWFCGGGCLLALIVAIAGGAWIFGEVKDALDPEKQWPKIQAILPYDERPAELELFWGSTIGMDLFMFHDQRGYVAVLMRFPAADADEARDQLMNPEFEGGVMGAGERKDLQAGTIRVQGRELDVLRFHQDQGGGGGGAGGRPDTGSGSSILVELSTPDAARPMILQLVRPGGTEPISDEEVQQFLEPFHVGPDR